MMVRLHKNATTTPATRRYIQSSNLPVRRLARELGVSEDTIRRWKKRTDVEDRPHTAHRLQTNLTPFQEAERRLGVVRRIALCARERGEISGR